jgi:outer membrane protein assembly factor BamB
MRIVCTCKLLALLLAAPFLVSPSQGKPGKMNRGWMNANFFCWAAVHGLVVLALQSRADDWPQWRGPNRDGRWNESGITESFPPGGLKISWRVPVGAGFSSPVVAEGRVYVTDSQISRPRARERVLCFDANTGKSLWMHSYEVDYADWAFDPRNPFGPRLTPIINAGRLFTLGAQGRLICFDVRNGKVVWTKKLKSQSRDSAFTPSPLIESNLLILVLDGGPPGPCVVALDKDSGSEVWKAIDEKATMSSPIIVTAANRRQLIVWTQGAVSALDPVTGKLYWRERHVGGASYAIPTPVTHGNLLFVNGVMFKLDTEKPAASVLWPDRRPPSRQTTSETSTPLFEGDYIFTCNVSGELVCIEAKGGQILWATNQVTDAKSGGSIHITPQGESALLFNDAGELIRAKLSAAGYEEISRSALLQPTYPFGERKRAWSAPAYANGRVFARSDEALVCASLAKP